MGAAAFAFGAGLLAPLNPCGFAMLPAFVSYYLAAPEADGTPHSVAGRTGDGLRVGVSVAAGFAGVFVIAAGIVSAGLRAVTQAVPWAAVAIGVVLAVLGVAVLSGRQLGTGFAPAREPRQRTVWHMVAFGAAYAVASLSCTLAVLLAVVAQAMATADPAAFVAVLGAYAAGAGLILIALTVTTALGRATLQRWLRRLLPAVTKLAGGVLVASGLYLVAYWLPRLIDPGSFGSRSIARLLEAPSVWLTRLVSDNQTAAVATAAVVIAVAAAVAWSRRMSGTSRPNGHEPSDDRLHAGPDADTGREEATWTSQP